MKIDVKISNIRLDGNQRATASVNFDDSFAVTGIKVMEGSKGLFVAMPSYKANSGFRDVCFPITKEFREELHGAVLNGYKLAISQLQGGAQRVQDEPEQFTEQEPDENFDEAEYSSAPKMGM